MLVMVEWRLDVCMFVVSCSSLSLLVGLSACLFISMHVCMYVCSVLPRISQRHGGVGVAKWNALVGVTVSNVGVVI